MPWIVLGARSWLWTSERVWQGVSIGQACDRHECLVDICRGKGYPENKNSRFCWVDIFWWDRLDRDALVWYGEYRPELILSSWALRSYESHDSFTVEIEPRPRLSWLYEKGLLCARIYTTVHTVTLTCTRYRGRPSIASDRSLNEHTRTRSASNAWGIPLCRKGLCRKPFPIDPLIKVKKSL